MTLDPRSTFFITFSNFSLRRGHKSFLQFLFYCTFFALYERFALYGSYRCSFGTVKVFFNFLFQLFSLLNCAVVVLKLIIKFSQLWPDIFSQCVFKILFPDSTKGIQITLSTTAFKNYKIFRCFWTQFFNTESATSDNWKCSIWHNL